MPSDQLIRREEVMRVGGSIPDHADLASHPLGSVRQLSAIGRAVIPIGREETREGSPAQPQELRPDG
jgi:hypothetical protein